MNSSEHPLRLNTASILLSCLLLTSCALFTPNSLETDSKELGYSATEITDISTEYSQLNHIYGVEPPHFTDITKTEAVKILPVIDIWPRVRDGFKLNLSVDNKRTLIQRSWYKKHQRYMDRVLLRAEPFLHHIVSEIDRRGMPMEFALLPIVESAYDPFAYSHGRAAGIWQFIPGTGKAYNLKQNWWYDGRRDVVESTRAALDYLTALQKQFDGDWLLALAAYNSGAGTVRKAIRKNKRAKKPLDYWSLKLPKETQAYVPKLIALAQIIREPKHFNISLRSIANEPQFDIVPIGAQLDLAKAAEMAEIEVSDLYRLNPGYNRWATDPDGPHRLVIPIQKLELFRTNLASLPPEHRVKWTRYKIKSGDSLIRIAKNFSTTPKLLKQINRIKGNMIRAGKTLLIPQASHAMAAYSLSSTQRKLAKQSRAPSGKTKKHYTVKQGDSFWTIARKHRVPVRSLAKWNSMATRDLLQVGQKMVIWVNGDKTNQATITTSSLAPSAKQSVRKLNYRVRNGDSLSRIADKFNISVAQITKWNSLSAKRYLQPGQKLTLFVDVRNL